MVRKDVLDNDVRVVTEQISSVRSVSIGVWVDVGSRDERPGEEGVSPFIEHMVLKGTRRRSAPRRRVARPARIRPFPPALA